MNTLAVTESELSRCICVSTRASTSGHCHVVYEVCSRMIHTYDMLLLTTVPLCTGYNLGKPLSSLVPDIVRLTRALSVYHYVLFEQLQQVCYIAVTGTQLFTFYNF